jgi:hypothetical protein
MDRGAPWEYERSVEITCHSMIKGTPMLIGKPALFVRAFVEVVDEAICKQTPGHGMSAMHLSWRTLDSVQGQTLRWLVEVFIQDWKSQEGWSQLTMPPDEEGARQCVILNLLVDHQPLRSS